MAASVAERPARRIVSAVISAPAAVWPQPFLAPLASHADSGEDGACQARLEALTAGRRRVARGEALFAQGDPLGTLYQVHAGQFKSGHADKAGRYQVTGFQITGELLGLDGIGADRHCLDAVALENSMVRTIPYRGLSELLHEFASLQHEFHRLMSRELVRSQTMMLLLGSLRAEGRVATFVLDLTQRLHERGWSSTSMLLRMSREDIGSYLGLTLETVSRTFSKLQSTGILGIDHRQIHVLDSAGLARIAGNSDDERISGRTARPCPSAGSAVAGRGGPASCRPAP